MGFSVLVFLGCCGRRGSTSVRELPLRIQGIPVNFSAVPTAAPSPYGTFGGPVRSARSR